MHKIKLLEHDFVNDIYYIGVVCDRKLHDTGSKLTLGYCTTCMTSVVVNGTLVYGYVVPFLKARNPDTIIEQLDVEICSALTC